MGKKVRGFSMVELLVAVLVMGVGVLGVTGLQVVSLQNNRDALLRSEALQMAYDVLDRMRINGAGDYDGVGFDDEPEAPTNCFANNCNTGQMTDFDIAIWKCSLGDHNETDVCDDLRGGDILPPVDRQPGLPDGQGSIAVDGAGIVTVSIRWIGFAGDIETLVVESQQ